MDRSGHAYAQHADLGGYGYATAVVVIWDGAKKVKRQNATDVMVNDDDQGLGNTFVEGKSKSRWEEKYE